MQAIRLLPNDTYTQRYAEWHKDVSQIPDVRLLELSTTSRMVVGHASQAVLESGVQLHHTYGTPVIPGSSFKGLIAHYTHQYYGPDWLNPDSEGLRQGQKIGKYAELLFGSTESAGYVQFLDAMWIPTDKRPLSKDVISVHQTEYYRKNTPPTDTDSPTVVTFLAVRNNQSFILPVIGPIDWINLVETLLEEALEKHGIGAKTNAGYGRMMVKSAVRDENNATKVEIDAFQSRLDSMSGSKVKSELPNIVPMWRQSQVSDYGKRIIAERILKKADEAKIDKTKPWYDELKKFIDSTQ
jgi:CRISPR-associated protein Cmr6